MIQSLANLLLERDGSLTREMLLAPGGFGLGQVPVGQTPDATTTSVCGYCSTGCALNVHLRQNAAIGLTPATDYPVNRGMACPKGWESLSVLDAPDRAVTPLLKNSRGKLEATDWNTALGAFAARFKAILGEHGPESVAFLSTGQITTEEMALLGALAKFGMGLIHGDGNTRQCMASAVVAYKESFGFDAPPYTYQDLEESDVLVLVGANPCIAHPILWQRVMRNPHRPEIVVVDPRRTETAMYATQHLALKPKSDLDLFYGLAHILIARGWIEREFIDAHTNGFEAFAAFVADYLPERVSETTGLTVEAIEKLARTIHEGQRVSFWWTMGVNQSHQGVRTAQSIINLALMTGHIGRPGTGANSITGQANAMGSRLFSNTTNLLGGHDFTNAQHREKIARLLAIDPARIPQQNSLAFHEILERILSGKIKGLWVIATNPAHSWISQHELLDVLGRLEFLVVQDMYHSTETAQLADLVLPAAGWGEKEGTFINSERRIGLVKKVARAPGQALTDFEIFRLIAQAWGCGELFERWTSPEEVFQILKELSRGQPCDFSGIDDYHTLDEQGGIQWPYVGQAFQPDDCQAGKPDLQRRLFADGRFFHADGRARFVFEPPRPLREPPNQRYPFTLLTGRGSAAQWHTQTRTKKSAVLRKLYPQSVYIEINPADAETLGIRPDEWIFVESQRGRIEARAFVTRNVPQGQIFLPMHYETVNQLTHAVFDPYSKQPAYKACAVRLRKIGTVVTR
ncbi:MAG TPA: nitrate reductase [Pirellulales bacterium]|nr:nitrate reductase [Pirellulales bacterium]